MKKKNICFALVILMVFCFSVTKVYAEVTQEQMDEAESKLNAKLDELFPTGEITIDVADSYYIDAYNALTSEQKAVTSYSDYIKGSINDSIQLFNDTFFKNDIKLDTGLIYENKKIYADGSLALDFDGENYSVSASYSYQLAAGCDEQGSCGSSGGSASKSINVKLNIIKADKDVTALLKTYRDKMTSLKTLKYDDLSWINMLLANDLNDLLSSQFITGSAAKYLFGPITKLNSDVDLIFDNRLGQMNSVENDINNPKWLNEDLIEIMFSGEFPVFYKGTLYENFSDTRFYIYYASSINIPNTTSADNYISVAEKRIKDYLNSDEYEIKVTQTNYNIFDNIMDVVEPEFLEGTISNIYNLNIRHDGKSSNFKFVLKKVPEENIKVPEINYLEEEYKILMKTTSSDIPNNSVIKVNKVDENTDRQSNIELVLNTDKAVAYEITLQGSNGLIKEVKNGVVTIKIPLPEGFDESNAKIYYVSEDGSKKEEFDVTFETINEIRYIVFNTNHFSTYVVAEKESVKAELTSVEENPKTSDTIFNSVLIGVISLVSLTGCIIYKKYQTNKK